MESHRSRNGVNSRHVSEFGRPLSAQNREEAELHAIERALTSLADLCAHALSQSLLHFRVKDAWSIGTLPNCAAHADALESQIQSLLSHSQLLPEQFYQASRFLKSVAGLRCVYSAAKHTAQLSWLMHQDAAHAHLVPFVCATGDDALLLVRKAVLALETREQATARDVKALWHALHTTRVECVRAVLQADGFPIAGRRIARAGIWSLCMAGDQMTEVVASVVLDEPVRSDISR